MFSKLQTAKPGKGKPSAVSAEEMTSVLHALPEAVVAVDAENRVTYVNAAAEALFETGGLHMFGLPLSGFVPQDSPAYGLIDQCRADHAAILSTGRRTRYPVHRPAHHDGAGGADVRRFPLRDADEADRIVALVDRMEAFSDKPQLLRQSVNIHQILEHVRRVAENGFAKGIRIVEMYYGLSLVAKIVDNHGGIIEFDC